MLFALALAVIPVGVDAQGTASASCAALSAESPVEHVRPCADQGDASAQYFLGIRYDMHGVQWMRNLGVLALLLPHTTSRAHPAGRTQGGHMSGKSVRETVGFLAVVAGLVPPSLFQPPQLTKSPSLRALPSGSIQRRV
jgi:hypothetical protein